MRKKTYRYFVSFAYDVIGNENGKDVSDAVFVYDEPLDTQDMLDKVKRDIATSIKGCSGITILFFKRIKDNRQWINKKEDKK